MRDDPTRTLTLRNRFASRLRGVFRRWISSYLQGLPGVWQLSESGIVCLNVDDALNAVERSWAEYSGEFDDVVDRHIEEGYKRGGRNSVRQLRLAGLDAVFGLTSRDVEAMDLLERNGLKLVKNVGEDVKKEMSRVITTGYNEGWGIDKIGRVLREEAMSMSVHRSNLIARTETIRAYNSAASNQYKRYGVEFYEWIAAASERTCPECMDLDGNVFKLNEGPLPPVHPACRCSIAPVTDIE